MTCTTYLNNVAQQVYPFMAKVSQLDNVPCHTAKNVQEWFEDKEFKVLSWPQNSVRFAGRTSLIHGSPTSQSTGVKGRDANVSVPDTMGHLQKSCGVHVKMCQSCFGDTKGTYKIKSLFKLL